MPCQLKPDLYFCDGIKLFSPQNILTDFQAADMQQICGTFRKQRSL